MNDKKIKILCEGAIMVALAQLLGYLKLGRLPQGGSVTLIMLPIFVYAYRRGARCGLAAGLALGLLQCTLDNSWNWGWQSILLDYLLAYMALGICGFFCKMRGGLYIGAIAGALGRLVMHTVSGYLYAREYLDLEIFGMHTTSPWVYSLIYNASYVLLSLIPCLIILFFLQKGKLLRKYM